jgi:hypothetical protein
MVVATVPRHRGVCSLEGSWLTERYDPLFGGSVEGIVTEWLPPDMDISGEGGLRRAGFPEYHRLRRQTKMSAPAAFQKCSQLAATSED